MKRVRKWFFGGFWTVWLLLSACASPESGEGNSIVSKTHADSLVPPAESYQPVPPADCEGPCLVVLGIAQDGGFPHANCSKNCCQKAWNQPALHQRVVSLGLADPRTKNYWIFEATPDFPSQWMEMQQRFPGYTFRGIFLTHAHIGHYTGLMHLGREVVGAKNIPVYCMPRLAAFLRKNGPWSQLVDLKNIEIHELSEDFHQQTDSVFVFQESNDSGKGLVIKPVLVPHRDEFSETVGYYISGPEKAAWFIPDIDKWHLWPKNIGSQMMGIDYAFLDGTFYRNGEIPGRDMSEIPHPFIEETMTELQSMDPATRNSVYFIHFNHTNPVLQPQSTARSEIREKGYRMAEEGMICPL